MSDVWTSPPILLGMFMAILVIIVRYRSRVGGLAMLKKSSALVLLILALSPSNAPFQTGGGAEQQQIAQIELPSAIRQNIDSCAVIEQGSAQPHGWSPYLLANRQSSFY